MLNCKSINPKAKDAASPKSDVENAVPIPESGALRASFKFKKVNWSQIDLLFTSLPLGESQLIIKNLYKYKKLKIIDLSPDFRLNNNNTRISFEDNNLDKYQEFINDKKVILNWFISSSLRSRAINSYAEKGLLFSGHRIAINYSIANIIFSDSDKVIDCGANFGSLWIYLNNLNIPITYIGI